MKYFKLFRVISLITILVLAIRCGKDEVAPREYPRVRTLEVTNITESGATFSAEIIHSGSQEITEKGFVWETDLGAPPTIESSEQIVISETINDLNFSYQISSGLQEGIKYVVRAYVKTDEYLVYGTSVNFLSLGSDSPIITSFEPTIGAWGDTVKISVENFSSIRDKNIFTFGGIKADIISNNSGVFEIIVPNSLLQIKSKISFEINQQSTNTEDYFVIDSPLINRISPNTSFVDSIITITGNSFNPDKEVNKVYFDNNEGIVLVAESKLLMVQIPNVIYSTRLVEINVNILEQGSPSSEISIKGWIKKNQIPHIESERIFATGFSIGDFGYFGLGLNASDEFREFQRYEPRTNSWTKIANFSGNARFRAASFVIDENAYVGTGDNGSSLMDDFYKYNPKTDTWIEINKFPISTRNGFGISTNGKGYLGVKFNPRNFWEYDPIKDLWTEMTHLNDNPVAGFVVANKIFMLSLDGSLYEYSFDTSQWNKKADLPDTDPADFFNFQGHSIDDKGYIIKEGRVYEYNFLTDTWRKILSFPGTPENAPTSFIVNELLYFSSGDFWEFDPNY